MGAGTGSWRFDANLRPIFIRLRAGARRRRPGEGFAVHALLVVGLTCLAVAATALAADAAAVTWAKQLPGGVRQWADRLTEGGRAGWSLVPLLVIGLTILAADWRRVPPRTAAAWREIGILVAFAFLAIAGSGIANDIVKEFVGRARPPLFGTVGHLALRPFSFAYAYQSFPSGHASTFGALGMCAALLWPRFRWPLLALAAALACTRVILGVHYPSDVVGGFVVGLAFTRGLAEAMARLHLGFARPPAGGIRPRTAALRAAWREDGPAGLARALAAALLRRPFGPAHPRQPGSTDVAPLRD